MLKKICRLLLLGLMVCAGSTCVTPTHVSSAPIVSSGVNTGVLLTHVYPATANGATHEVVAIYNNTPDPIEITNWCIVNKANNPLVCFQNQEKDAFFIDGYGRVVIASEEYAELLTDDQRTHIDSVFMVANKTSGSLVGSGDTVRIKDAGGRVVSEFSWASAPAKGSGYARTGFDEMTLHYSEGSYLELNILVSVEGGGLYAELHITDDSSEEGSVEGGGLRLSEMVPNPVGADTGSEFIEIYNESQQSLTLDGYRFRITGGSSDKTFAFPSGVSIEPREYRAFYDTEMKFSLNNTLGSVSLLRADGGDMALVDTVSYTNPKEGQAWAYFEEQDGGGWSYTTRPTPNQINLKNSLTEPLAVLAVEQKSCNDNQYRNPLTGRCKKKTAVATVTPCKAGQYRSEETGRCRNVVAAKEPTPCKQGQERNPETNRCRNSKKMTNADHKVEVKPVLAPGGVAWYAWALVGIIIVGVLAYGAWEWREELRRAWGKFRKQKA